MTKRKQMKLVNTTAIKVLQEVYNRIGFSLEDLQANVKDEVMADVTIVLYDELKKAGVFDE